jgi:hypothetical protein
MARFRWLTLGLTLAAVLAIGRTAAADPIRITSGYLTFGGAQDFSAHGFLVSVSCDFSTDSFRLRGAEGDGLRQNVFVLDTVAGIRSSCSAKFGACVLRHAWVDTHAVPAERHAFDR